LECLTNYPAVFIVSFSKNSSVRCVSCTCMGIMISSWIHIAVDIDGGILSVNLTLVVIIITGIVFYNPWMC